MSRESWERKPAQHLDYSDNREGSDRGGMIFFMENKDNNREGSDRGGMRRIR